MTSQMEQLELERLLEAGFYALGVEFSSRMYGEEIKLGSEIDDQTGPISIQDVKELQEKAKSPEERCLIDLHLMDALSNPQKDVYKNLIPFFRRRSDLFDELFVIYQVFSEEELSDYESNADRIIKEGKIASEHIIIINSINQLVANLDINRSCGKISDACAGPDYGYEWAKDPEIKEWFDIIKRLEGKPYDPKEVYKAVMDFIKW